MSLLLCFWGGRDLQASGLRLFGIQFEGRLLRGAVGRLLELFAKVHEMSAERRKDWTPGFAWLFTMQLIGLIAQFLLPEAGKLCVEFKRVEHDGSSFWITSVEVINSG